MLTPDEIASRQFLIALRGYDRDEVQAFLNEVADEHRRLQERVDELETQLRDGGSTPVAASTSDAADDGGDVVAPASEVEATKADTSRFAGLDASEPKAVFTALGEETTRILVAAEESARSIRERAEERARTELESSRREARDEVAGARRTASKIISDAEGRRNAVAEEIQRLESTRDRYAEDLRGAVVTVQNAMRSISTSGNASAGGREGESAATPSASRTDADADDPARAGSSSALLEHETLDGAADGADLAASDLEADSLGADTLDADTLGPDTSEPAAGSDASAKDVVSSDDTAAEGDRDDALDRIEADIRAAEERGADDGATDDADTSDHDTVDSDAADDEQGSAAPDGDDADASLEVDHGAQTVAAALSDETTEDADLRDALGVAASGVNTTGVDTTGVDTTGVHTTGVDTTGVELTGAQLGTRALDLRNAALHAVRPGALRILKRSLQDVQNGVLDALRRAGGEPGVADLLPPSSDLAELGEAAQPHLATAHGAGVQDGLLLAGASSDVASSAADHGIEASVTSLADALGSDITTHLRASLTQGMATGERQAELGERVGEVFRDLKGATAEAIVDGELLRAYAWGLLAAWQAADVDGKRWVHGEELRCPEDMCQTNAAAGTLPLDASFPTGEVVPPPHDGCDCTLAPAS